MKDRGPLPEIMDEVGWKNFLPTKRDILDAAIVFEFLHSFGPDKHGRVGNEVPFPTPGRIRCLADAQRIIRIARDRREKKRSRTS